MPKRCVTQALTQVRAFPAKICKPLPCSRFEFPACHPGPVEVSADGGAVAELGDSDVRSDDRLPACGGDRAHTGAMVAWRDVEAAEPEFAARVRRLFDAGRHKTIATLRVDGSPRVSGIECEFADGELRFGSMPGARKGADLRRDPRFALHGPAFHPEEGKEAGWPGEAKIAGRAVLAGPIGDGAGGDLFRCRHCRGRHHPAEPGGDVAGHRVVDAATGASRGRTRMMRAPCRIDMPVIWVIT